MQIAYNYIKIISNPNHYSIKTIGSFFQVNTRSICWSIISLSLSTRSGASSSINQKKAKTVRLKKKNNNIFQLMY